MVYLIYTDIIILEVTMAIYVKVIEEGILKKYIPGYNVEEIVLPDHIHTVGENCFNPWSPERIPVDNKFELEHWDDYMKIKTVVIPSHIQQIRRYAFIQIPNLEAFVLQEGCTAAKIYDDALISYDGKALMFCPPKKYGDFAVPYGVETIWENAFEASELSNVVLPDTVTEIEDDAFALSEISSVYIPKSVKKIGKRVFKGSRHLTVKAAKGSYAIEYARENEIAYREVSEESIRERASEIKKPYYASYKTDTGTRYRKQQFGYPFEWNGILFYSENINPEPGIWLTEAVSGVKLDYGKLCNTYQDNIEALLEKLGKFGPVNNLPTYDEVFAAKLHHDL